MEKVRRITELACGETPEYFLAPMIGDEDGNPLSKSHDTGLTVDEIDDLEGFSERLLENVRGMIEERKEYVVQDELF